MREFLSALESMASGSLKPFVYRVAPYVVLSLLDDPAMLALAFC